MPVAPHNAEPLSEETRVGLARNLCRRTSLRGPCGQTGQCHAFMGGITNGGYGLVSYRGRQFIASRVAFYLAHGRWPLPYALHRCDNPSCVNPEHLFEGDDQANATDRDSKGRCGASGLHLRKITDAQVSELRKRV